MQLNQKKMVNNKLIYLIMNLLYEKNKKIFQKLCLLLKLLLILFEEIIFYIKMCLELLC